MLQINQLSKTYKDGTHALNDITLQFPLGEIVGIFGENGAGKTTFMKCILQFLAYSGEITLDGEKITWKNIEKISFATCEHSFFPQISAAAHRDFYEENFPNFRGARFDGLMEFFQLPAHRPLKSFSIGQKNQFEVICALCQGAEYILMDEPFAGNDIFNREDFYKVLLGILEPEETILLSTHLLEEVEHFIGRAVLLKKGCLLQDVSMEQLEEQGHSLIDFMKESYSYEANRVGRALKDLTQEENL